MDGYWDVDVDLVALAADMAQGSGDAAQDADTQLIPQSGTEEFQAELAVLADPFVRDVWMDNDPFPSVLGETLAATLSQVFDFESSSEPPLNDTVHTKGDIVYNFGFYGDGDGDEEDEVISYGTAYDPWVISVGSIVQYAQVNSELLEPWD